MKLNSKSHCVPPQRAYGGYVGTLKVWRDQSSWRPDLSILLTKQSASSSLFDVHQFVELIFGPTGTVWTKINDKRHVNATLVTYTHLVYEVHLINFTSLSHNLKAFWRTQWLMQSVLNRAFHCGLFATTLQNMHSIVCFVWCGMPTSLAIKHCPSRKPKLTGQKGIETLIDH